jgi:uncharacterized protein (DUF2126 family)
VDFLVELNRRLQQHVAYVIRLDPGVQSKEQTLELRSGSCRDSTWLLVQLLRHLGLAARFVSGYLIQLVADQRPVDGPAGPERDFTDLHAWCEVYLPGAGWIGLDPTSGLLAGEGHLPLSCTPEPASAAPVTGAVDECDVTFEHAMRVERLYESPRVTKPYRDDQWTRIASTGHAIDKRLAAQDVRLSMGGEPTFVSAEDRDGDEWNTQALGATKRLLAADLLWRLRDRFAPNGFVHFGQGKWYPGEQLPRWALNCYWRADAEPAWHDVTLFADERRAYEYGAVEAERFIRELADRLGVSGAYVRPGYEDAWYYLWRERRLPTNVDPFDSRLDDELERDRLRRVFDQRLDASIGYALPLARATHEGSSWRSGPWFLRAERLYLMPGDSPMGYRLPLDSLPWVDEVDYPYLAEYDPMDPRPPLPVGRVAAHVGRVPSASVAPDVGRVPSDPVAADVGRAPSDPVAADVGRVPLDPVAADVGRVPSDPVAADVGRVPLDPVAADVGRVPSDPVAADVGRVPSDPVAADVGRVPSDPVDNAPARGESAPWIVRSALCTEVRNGILYVFLPPLGSLEHYLELVSAIEATAASLGCPVLLEGYPPPHDPRLRHFSITPDPGVIEVNIQPAACWDELVHQTTTLYEEAHQSRLTPEKFMIDGRHVGTGGGNHFVLGGATPADSPFLRRPDLLRSLVAYWHNHPSLSYLFSGLFIGPTSQAPRVDEARHDSVYELEIAFAQLPPRTSVPRRGSSIAYSVTC